MVKNSVNSHENRCKQNIIQQTCVSESSTSPACCGTGERYMKLVLEMKEFHALENSSN